jgi:hypothetical protein
MVHRCRDIDGQLLIFTGQAEVHDGTLTRVQPVPEFIERRSIALHKANNLAIKRPHLLEHFARRADIEMVDTANGHIIT